MSAESDTTFENVEQVEQSIERGEEERAEEQQERKEAHDDEQAILSAIQSDRVTIRLKGKRMKFQPLLGDTEDWIDDLAAKYNSDELADVDDPDELEGDDLQQYKRDREHVVDILVDHNLDEGKFDRAFFQKLPQELRFEALTKIRQGGEETGRAGN